MNVMLLFLLVAAFGNCFYHIGQKSLDIGGNPMLLLSCCYAAALLLTLAAAPWFGEMKLAQNWRELAVNWRIWLVAAGTVLIECGFLLAYRSGGSAQWSGVAVNGTAALMLIPLSLLVFHESFSLQKLAGIVLTLAGLYFLVKK